MSSLAPKLQKRKGIDNTPKEEHLEAAKLLAENIFQPIRECFATPIFISSGYRRSDALNEAIGGSKTSHIQREGD